MSNNKQGLANEECWYLKSVKEVLTEVESFKKGLTDDEALARLKVNGPNKIAEEEKNKTLKLFLRNFNSLLIYILMGSAVISILSNHLVEFIVICVIIIFTGFFGFIQEYHAGKSLEALSLLTVSDVIVIRNGKKVKISKENIVKGDIVVLERGMLAPADLRIIESNILSVDESILTGESDNKYKQSNRIDKQGVLINDQDNMVFAGTSITNGHGLGVVVATGLESEIGKISMTLKQIGYKKSPIQRQIDVMSRKIAYLVISACIFLMILLLSKNVGIFEALILVGAVAVSGIPESFPLALTMALSNGVKRMAKKNAIVKDLSSVETLGTTTVICTDKTGTLTENKMFVEKIFFADGTEIGVNGKGYVPSSVFTLKNKQFNKDKFKKYNHFFKACLLCNNSQLSFKSNEWILSGESTEGSMLALAKSADFDDKVLCEDNKRICEVPFNPFEKFMITVNQEKVKSKKVQTAYLKGAAEKVLQKCTHIRTKQGKIRKLTKRELNTLTKQVHVYANLTYRVLGLATKVVKLKNVATKTVKVKKFAVLETGFVFEGLVGINDPVRSHVYDAIKECQDANIKVVIITGDHKHTAMSVGKKLSLIKSKKNLVVEGFELDGMTDDQLDKVISKIVIFSRTTPDHKFRIVSSLQRVGEIVAMTGDGVNDAPALKKADIGISMGKSGTDVAREASNMVLVDDHFSTIVNAIKEGRTIYSNIRRFVYYLLTGNITEVSLILFAVIIGLATPLTALMVLFVNLVTSSFPALALSIEPTRIKVMKQKPRNPKEKLLSKYILLKIAVLVPFLFLGVLSLFLWELNIPGGDLQKARTIVFATLIMFELMHVLNARSLHTTIFSNKFFSNKYIFFAIGASLVLTILAIYTNIGQKIFNTVPLSAFEWLIIILISSLVILVNEVIKALIKSEFKEQKNLKGLNVELD